MTDEIDQVVRANITALAQDPARHDELRALAMDGQRELPEVKAAAEALIGGGSQGTGPMDTLCDAFLNKLLDSNPVQRIDFDCLRPGGGEQHSVYELPNGEALVCSVGDGWSGPYESVAQALDKFSWLIPSIQIWHSEDFSEELAAVPDDQDRILIEGETYHRSGGMWHTDGDGPIYVLYRGTWMSEDEALDAENSDNT